MTSPADKPNWREHFDVHPAAELFPLISEPELRWLGEDIKKNGMLSPLVMWEVPGEAKARFLIDGRNRLEAAALLGILALDEHERLCIRRDDGELKEIRKSYSSQSADPYALVLSLNIYRRHLTPEQRREVISKVLKARPELSDRTIAKFTKVSDKTVGSVRRELESNAEIPHKPDRAEQSGRKARGRKPKSTSAKPVPAPTPATAQQAAVPDIAGAPDDGVAEILIGNALSALLTSIDRFQETMRGQISAANKDRYVKLFHRLDEASREILAVENVSGAAE